MYKKVSIIMASAIAAILTVSVVAVVMSNQASAILPDGCISGSCDVGSGGSISVGNIGCSAGAICAAAGGHGGYAGSGGSASAGSVGGSGGDANGGGAGNGVNQFSQNQVHVPIYGNVPPIPLMR